MRHFPDIDPALHGLRAIIVATAEKIRDTCGFAVPFMTYDGDFPLHASRFVRSPAPATASPGPARPRGGRVMSKICLRV